MAPPTEVTRQIDLLSDIIEINHHRLISDNALKPGYYRSTTHTAPSNQLRYDTLRKQRLAATRLKSGELRVEAKNSEETRAKAEKKKEMSLFLKSVHLQVADGYPDSNIQAYNDQLDTWLASDNEEIIDDKVEGLCADFGRYLRKYSADTARIQRWKTKFEIYTGLRLASVIFNDPVEKDDTDEMDGDDGDDGDEPGIGLASVNGKEPKVEESDEIDELI